ncbi:phosphatidylinositol-4-phosphate 5-kinase 2 [Striga asiatica]|uniref:Phosphatidylinositol-4-phosphate 5-kinase 2 n=1 Tax=Striga asiatica TaxID=4170 RepID=A0A5A7P825_STRAF|nr:phosphatidylinositol-4-phosphate 5-kinase 2 [Striga asiatica]
MKNSALPTIEKRRRGVRLRRLNGHRGGDLETGSGFARSKGDRFQGIRIVKRRRGETRDGRSCESGGKRSSADGRGRQSYGGGNRHWRKMSRKGFHSTLLILCRDLRPSFPENRRELLSCDPNRIRDSIYELTICVV